MTDPLCKDEEDDKHWKKAVRGAKEDIQSRRRGGYSYSGYSRRSNTLNPVIKVTQAIEYIKSKARYVVTNSRQI